MTNYPDYPLHIGGTQKDNTNDLSWKGGDFATTPSGDLATVSGAEKLGQFIARSILGAKPKDGKEAEAAMKAAVQQRRDNIETVVAFRSDDKVAEVDFIAVGYPQYTQQIVFKK